MGIAIFPVIAPYLARLLNVDASYVGYQISMLFGVAMLASIVVGTVVLRWGACRGMQWARWLAAAGMVIALVGELWVMPLAALCIGASNALAAAGAAHLLFRFGPPKHRNLIFSIKQCFARYRQAQDDVAAAELMFKDPDADMRAMAQDEFAAARERSEQLELDLQKLLLPTDPLDNSNIFLEIRAGTGGDEAAIFAGDLFRMYSRYAETQRWQVEVLSENPGEHGGYKEIIARIIGQGAYSKLKFESGAHRVQRVPATEAQGRIHTSAATVAVMPEPDETEEIVLNPADLKTGAGLAAPQIGVGLRVVIFGFESSPRYPQAEPVPQTVLINPELAPLDGEEEAGWEGGLSVPGLRGWVPRAKRMRYRGFDARGSAFERTVARFHARVVQHECDRLDGILYPMRMRDFSRFGFTDVLFPDGSVAPDD